MFNEKNMNNQNIHVQVCKLQWYDTTKKWVLCMQSFPVFMEEAISEQNVLM
jgi:hypothetical protein